MKRLEELIKNLRPEFLHRPETPIAGLTDDSREVKPGYAFVACRGTSADGHKFIPQALEAGAVAILAERKLDLPDNIAQVVLPDTRKALPELASAFYDYPEKDLIFIGVTGTNGKTSVTYFLYQILVKLTGGVGLIGTIFYDTGLGLSRASLTTPGPVKLRALLAAMRQADYRHVVMEVSSHALDQDRVAGLAYHVAGFTNLSRDHLDYHGTMEAYYQAKKKLFTEYLRASGQAVINVANPWGRRLAEEISAPVIKIGEDLRGMVTERSQAGYSFLLEYGHQKYPLATTLYGDFQLENLLIAIGCGLALGFSFEDLLSCSRELKPPPGRLEPVGQKNGALIFVDYAHTPEALAVALKSLKPMARRLIVLFGCGGDRDKGKRPLMGQVAEDLADIVILTSDNPRSEKPEDIINDIMAGMKKTPFLVEPDRYQAMVKAVSALEKGDVLLVAGKGHEDYQEISGKRIPFSDREVLRELLTEEEA
ncbi:UDP-N-acetylmuramyl-tripeptide synthetase [Thermodesulfatator indicus DSM 15286]|uniref:UDP-N-acetylmuramoyl-L-alanyl-D-glutamate--2,6-diaminopimelate ligase n=1 Tax=Thermodesulfatator indicus (strain DSM 15286 / JCM 11887 / CIR29812) TaxID=667014 RepID=F8AAP7_THEID|nr:UDP-N-acetylmuramoyl-L-alanyl-D-glutamate--2,6-diaminopimelate ligase [Thermodesulfatator indicus]AEH44320.1 UDP-N-acetylmuramyl-tripeptide synthetase [Thermodesulfatator indicus DSM 15286]